MHVLKYLYMLHKNQFLRLSQLHNPQWGQMIQVLGHFRMLHKNHFIRLNQLHTPHGTDDANSEAFSSSSQESVTEGETSLEWLPTPEVQHRLHSI